MRRSALWSTELSLGDPVRFVDARGQRLMNTSKLVSRRSMVAATAGSLAAGRARATPPSDKMNIAFVGIGGYGARGLRELASQNIVALCDVDWRPASQTAL